MTSSLAVLLLSPACLIQLGDGEEDDGYAADDDTGGQGYDDGTGNTPNDEGGDSTSGGGESEGGDTTGGEVPGECLGNPILDPGFESGTPSSAWDERSDLFGTPLCDVSCTADEGAAPRSGDWWAWFGGVEEPEAGSVSQTVVIPPADFTSLTFHLWINAAAGTGDDVFTVLVDDEVVFMATDAEQADYAEYTRVDVDLSAYADGAEHRITFVGEQAGTGLTSFFLDDVDLFSCSEPGSDETGAGSDDTGGSDDSADTDGGESTSGAGTTTGSETEGSSTG